jgi:hypothetical protein
MNSTAKELKKEGQERVMANTNDEWRARALDALKALAEKMKRFTADDFRTFCEERGVGQPPHPNAWGPLFTSGGSQGWMRKTNDYGQSSNPASHAHTYVIWESLLLPDDTVVAHGQFVEWLVKVPGKRSRGFSTAAKAIEFIPEYAEIVGCRHDEVKLYKAICEEQPI